MQFSDINTTSCSTWSDHSCCRQSSTVVTAQLLSAVERECDRRNLLLTVVIGCVENTYGMTPKSNQSTGVHGNGSSDGNGISMRFPREWELDLNMDGNRNGNTTTWEREQLMLVGSQNHSNGLVKSHYATLRVLCLQHSHKSP